MDPDPQPCPEALLGQAAFVRALARGLVLGDLEVEDLVQETLAMALERPPRQPGALAAWLGRVARGLAWKARRRGRARERRERLAAPLAPAPSPVEILCFQERLLVVGAAVRTLPDPLRVAIHLRYFEGLGPPAMAERLGEPVETVKSRLKRALARLRELLDESHGGDRKRWLEGLAPLLAPWAPGGLVPGAAPGAGAGLAASMLLGGIGMKKLLLAGSVAALLLLLGLMVAVGIADWFSGAPDPGAPLPMAAGDPSRRALPPVPPSPGEAPRQAAQPLPIDPAERFSPQPADGWLVELVRPEGRGEDGKERFEPVPFAELCLLCPNLIEDYNAFRDYTNRWARAPIFLDESYRTFGRDYQADAQGQVRLPRPPDPGTRAVGRKEGLWGSAQLPFGDTQPFRLILRPDVRLRVQVVDQEGRPVPGVPVCLFGGEYRAREYLITPALWTEGREGIVEFGRVRDLIDWWKAMTREEPRLEVQLAIPLLEPVRSAVDTARLPADPVRLVLPPTGSVVVQAARPGDLPPGGRIRASLGRRDPERSGPASLGPEIEADAVEGIARFPHVGLGLELYVGLSPTLPGAGLLSRSRQEQIGAGPIVAGEEVRFRFPDEPGLPWLTGRVVDEEGRPLAARILGFSFFLQVAGDDQATFPLALRTDQEGRFLLPVSTFWRPGPEAMLLVATRQGAEGPARDGCLALPRDLEPGRREVGTIALRRSRLLAAGRVVDGQGRPLPNVRVDFFLPEALDTGRLERFPAGRLAHLTTGTDREGRFSCASSMDLESLCVVAELPGHIRLARIVPAGTSDLELVLERGVLLFGSLVFPEWASPRDFRLEARYTDRPETQEHRAYPLPDGRFGFQDLSAGVLTIQVRLRSGALVHEEAGILVEGGGSLRHPRLQGLDLRGKIRVIELEVVDSSGAPVASGEVFGLDQESPVGSIHRGQARLLATPGSLDLLVTSPEHRNTILRGVQGPCRVMLEPGLPVLLEAMPKPEVPAGFLLRATLTPENSKRGRFKNIGPEGKARLVLPGPGAYDVEWSLFPPRKAPSGKPTRIDLCAPQRIAVVDAPGEQVFRLALDPEALRRAVEESRKR